MESKNLVNSKQVSKYILEYFLTNLKQVRDK